MSNQELYALLQEIDKRWKNPQVQYDLAFGDLGDMMKRANAALKSYFIARYLGSIPPTLETDDDGA